jgi:L-alanine-DL-glutamate epimerase-like enolase superfamily enzyme
MRITDYRIQKLIASCDPPISDSQTDDQQYGIAYLELDSETGDIGIGFGGVSPSTPQEVLERRFERVGEELVGESPFHLVARMQRSRGGDYPPSEHGGFGRAVDFALWDLCGKHLDMPLYELLGGEDPRVPAYASGLLFTVDDREVRRRYEEYADRGFNAAKVKVGYPTIEEDIDRIELVRDAMDGDITLTLDANEAFSPKEAIRRAHAYRDAGLDVYWFEDPVIRADVDGIRRVAESVPFALINTGEYVNVEGKRELLENGACDLLNIRMRARLRVAGRSRARTRSRRPHSRRSRGGAHRRPPGRGATRTHLHRVVGPTVGRHHRAVSDSRGRPPDHPRPPRTRRDAAGGGACGVRGLVDETELPAREAVTPPTELHALTPFQQIPLLP